MRRIIKLSLIIVFIFALVFSLYMLSRHYAKSKFYSGVLIKGKILVSGDSLGQPNDIICVGRYLVLLDANPVRGRGKIQVYDRTDGRFITSTGFSGSGPGEIQNPIHLSNVAGDSLKFSVYDLSLRRLTIYSLSGESVKVYKMINLKDGLPYSPVVVDTLIFSLDFNIDADGRITVYDLEGRRIKTIGKLLPGLSEGVPIPVHQVASQGKLRVSPDGNFIVAVANYSDIVDVYNKAGDLVCRFHGPLNVVPKYRAVSRDGAPVMAIDVDKAIWGYPDVSLTKNHIYARFSGKKFKERGDGRYIHIYSYDGKFVRSFILDREVYDIVYDEGSGKIFALQLYPDQSVLVYEVK